MAPSNGTSNGSSSSRLVGRFTEATLLKKAKEVVAEKSKASTMFDEEAEKAMPRFKKSGKFYIYVLGTYVHILLLQNIISLCQISYTYSINRSHIILSHTYISNESIYRA